MRQPAPGLILANVNFVKKGGISPRNSALGDDGLRVVSCGDQLACAAVGSVAI